LFARYKTQPCVETSPINSEPAVLNGKAPNIKEQSMKKAILFAVLCGILSACNTVHSIARDANTAVQAWNEDYQNQHKHR
jgi:hypothetical protein